MNEEIQYKISEYFDYIARSFPVMSASDEFHFLPRAEKAASYYDQLEAMDAGTIVKRISDIRDFRRSFRNFRNEVLQHRSPIECGDHLETLIDMDLLAANAAGVLIELESKQSYRYNPLIYLKIAFIGVDHAASKPFDEKRERLERFLSRLFQVPRLLNQAVENLEAVPESYFRPSLAMIRDSKKYLEAWEAIGLTGKKDLLSKGVQLCVEALERLEGRLKTIGAIPEGKFSCSPITDTLEMHFRTRTSLTEIYAEAECEFMESLKNLEKLSNQIDDGHNWLDIYNSDIHQPDENISVFELYRREIDCLCRFFSNQEFWPLKNVPDLELATTPVYLESVRSAASFGCAFSRDEREKYYFFITTGEQRKQNGEDLNRRLHREYKFLTAHETAPGHFLLDAVRRCLKNPVRRQIESPLFYEGWAYYAESLLDECGYIQSPFDRLVDQKRRLWREARCMIDAGGAIGKVNRQKAVELLTGCGFSVREAAAQAARFRMNPGYQLCYSHGRRKIIGLIDKYAPEFGKKGVLRKVLQGGEIPFHLIDKRLSGMMPEKKIE